MLPILVDIAAVPVVLVGGGDAAVARLVLLDRDRADVSVFAPEAETDLGPAAGARLQRRLPTDAEIAAARLVFIAGLSPAQSAPLAAAARRAGVLVNTEDQPKLCDFHIPAIVRRGDLTLTVSTAGKAPAIARLLRERLEAEFGKAWAEHLAEAAEWRRDWRAEGVPMSQITERTRRRMIERGWL